MGNESKAATLWHNLHPRLVAILRGVQPGETAAIVAALLETGFRAIEIPLNSPEPLTSIRIASEVARESAHDGLMIGAGTVLEAVQVEQVVAAGGNLIVSPDTNPDVIRQSVVSGVVSVPGVMTPTECFRALAAGATALKFFPASLIGPQGIKAMRAVLPANVSLCAVGGVDEQQFADYQAAGVDAFGLGSNLYKAGDSAEQVHQRAQKILACWQQAQA